MESMVIAKAGGRGTADLGRTEILDAAATAFTRHGYTATTIDDIAERLGATKGRVYHYYRVEMHRLRQLSAAEQAMGRIIALRDAYEQLFVDVVAQGIRAGEFRTVDPHLAAKPLLGALNWISIWYDPDRGAHSADGVRGRAALDRVADGYADFVVNGLLHREARR